MADIPCHIYGPQGSVEFVRGGPRAGRRRRGLAGWPRAGVAAGPERPSPCCAAVVASLPRLLSGELHRTHPPPPARPVCAPQHDAGGVADVPGDAGHPSRVCGGGGAGGGAGRGARPRQQAVAPLRPAHPPRPAQPLRVGEGARGRGGGRGGAGWLATAAADPRGSGGGAGWPPQAAGRAPRPPALDGSGSGTSTSPLSAASIRQDSHTPRLPRPGTAVLLQVLRRRAGADAGPPHAEAQPRGLRPARRHAAPRPPRPRRPRARRAAGQRHDVDGAGRPRVDGGRGRHQGAHPLLWLLGQGGKQVGRAGG